MLFCNCCPQFNSKSNKFLCFRFTILYIFGISILPIQQRARGNFLDMLIALNTSVWNRAPVWQKPDPRRKYILILYCALPRRGSRQSRREEPTRRRIPKLLRSEQPALFHAKTKCGRLTHMKTWSIRPSKKLPWNELSEMRIGLPSRRGATSIHSLPKIKVKSKTCTSYSQFQQSFFAARELQISEANKQLR